MNIWLWILTAFVIMFTWVPIGALGAQLASRAVNSKSLTGTESDEFIAIFGWFGLFLSLVMLAMRILILIAWSTWRSIWSILYGSIRMGDMGANKFKDTQDDLFHKNRYGTDYSIH
ncbi:MAG: hypothetical protein A3H51_02300 [Candidatus Spechtbacteria bacterium RIFCSPLOWO2_02_FULL_38_8]|uniref:Uncharacterized protein n=1 Tax=Candidatus Spechtbacteria bacterium RIFCSPLOWO2_02_FULL_38_8 TaxID=1802164 RepID=A0A1G2HJZ0_9BACT|nr:MAG: hypothetical protein A3H51_02300 [Candidatus Spechtbacteria bacterium RIFCSPLOWO2_02_FULL_38_8]